MDNPFLCGPEYLKKHWRAIRSQLTSEKTDLEHLEITMNFWSKTPISAPYLDWDHPNIWPGPWEFIAEMNFDESCVAIGMEYTLILAEDQRWTPDRLQLNLVISSDRTKQLLILVVDKKYVLNYSYNLILPFELAGNDLVIQQKYTYINKMHKIQDLKND